MKRLIMKILSSMCRASDSWVCGGQQHSRCDKGKLWSGKLQEISSNEICYNNQRQVFRGGGLALIMESFCRKYNVSYRIRKPQDGEYGSDTDGDGQAR